MALYMTQNVLYSASWDRHACMVLLELASHPPTEMGMLVGRGSGTRPAWLTYRRRQMTGISKQARRGRISRDKLQERILHGSPKKPPHGILGSSFGGGAQNAS